jgi:uncharacterized membrane protein
VSGQSWIAYALATFLMFGITNFILKYASVKGVPSLEGSAILLMGAGLAGIVATIYMIVEGMFDSRINPHMVNLNPKYFTLMVIAGITLALGMYFLKMAVAHGPAGPATAIALSNAVLVAALSWVILGEKLSVSELIGMTLYVTAIIVFALKPLG